MLVMPISQQDLEDRHPDLESELWSTHSAAVDGRSCVLAYVSGTTWTLTDSTASFALTGLPDKFGVLRGFWGFKVVTRDSGTQLTITPTEYPVSITDDLLDHDIITSYSIGGYAPQMIAAAETIIADLTNMNVFAEGMDTTLVNLFQLQGLFIAKTLSTIFFDLSMSKEDIWWERYLKYETDYSTLKQTIRYEYTEPEDTIPDLYFRNVTVRR